MRLWAARLMLLRPCCPVVTVVALGCRSHGAGALKQIGATGEAHSN